MRYYGIVPTTPNSLKPGSIPSHVAPVNVTFLAFDTGMFRATLIESSEKLTVPESNNSVSAASKTWNCPVRKLNPVGNCVLEVICRLWTVASSDKLMVNAGAGSLFAVNQSVNRLLSTDWFRR